MLILVRIFLSHVCFRFRPGKLLRSRIVRVIERHPAPFHPGNDIVILLRRRASSLDNLRRIGSTKICFSRRILTRIRSHVTCCSGGRFVPRRQSLGHMSSEKDHISARQLRYHLPRREISALHVVIHVIRGIVERILVYVITKPTVITIFFRRVLFRVLLQLVKIISAETPRRGHPSWHFSHDVRFSTDQRGDDVRDDTAKQKVIE